MSVEEWTDIYGTHHEEFSEVAVESWLDWDLNHCFNWLSYIESKRSRAAVTVGGHDVP